MSHGHSNIHASAVLVGASAVLIQGSSGAGKSRLAFALLQAAESGLLAFARLVGDDRVLIEPAYDRLLVRPVPTLAGLLEVRGLGIRRVAYEPVAVVKTIVELGASDASRLPENASLAAQVAGVLLPRLAVAAGVDPMPLLIAYLRTAHISPD